MPKGEKKRKEWMVLGGELALGEKEDPLAFACMNTINYFPFMFIHSA
jgi:hypothetical protein